MLKYTKCPHLPFNERSIGNFNKFNDQLSKFIKLISNIPTISFITSWYIIYFCMLCVFELRIY